MPRYNHLVTIAFSIVSDDARGEDLTPAMLKEALFARIRDLDASTQGVNGSKRSAPPAIPVKRSRRSSPIPDIISACANGGQPRTMATLSAIVRTTHRNIGISHQRARP